MHRQHFTQDPRMPGLTYGFFESFENGQRTLFHGGGIRGFMSGIYLWPEHRLGLFVADNGYDGGGLVWAVADGFLLFPVLLVLGFRQAAQGAGLLYGVPPLVTAALVLPLLAAPLVPVLLVLEVRAWREGWWSPRRRFHLTLVALGAVAFLVLLNVWNLLGFRY